MDMLRTNDTVNNYRFYYDKPNLCPHCGRLIDAKTWFVAVGHDIFTGFFTCTFTSCKKTFFATYRKSEIKSDNLIFVNMYPKHSLAELTVLRGLSDRFSELYNQAADAEIEGNYDLAACGYRNAIEALVKDYGIVFKGVEPDEKLMKKNLNNCIGDFLDGIDEALSAYMVKEFGNAATHYPQVGVVFDFNEQKEFLGAFLNFMTNKVKIQILKKEVPDKFLQRFETPQEGAPEQG